MSIRKKLFSIVSLALLVVALVSCVTPTKFQRTKAEAQDLLETVAGRIDFTVTELTRGTDIVFTTSTTLGEKVSFEWSTNNTAVISNTGKVTRPEFGSGSVEVVVTCVINVEYKDSTDGSGKVSETKTWTFTIIEAAEEFTIAQIKEMEKGSVVAFKGVVVSGTTDNRYFVNDGTDGLYIYSVEETLKVGQEVYVQGILDAGYSILQIGYTDLKIDVLNENAELPAYNDENITIQQIVDRGYDNAATSKLGKYGGRLYRLYAKYEVLKGTDGFDDFILSDPNTGAKLEVYYKSQFSFIDNAASTLVDTLKPYDGKYVYINVVTYDIFSTDGSHRVVLAPGAIEEAPEPVISDEDKASMVLNELKDTVFASVYYSGDAIELPTSTIDGVTAEWTAVTEGLIVDGKIVTEKSYEVEKITLTVTCGTVVKTAEVEILVAAEKIILSVADAKAKENKAVVVVKGLVQAVYTRGFVLYDTTGAILVYTNSAVKVNVGDYVEAFGKKSVYPDNSTCYQIGTPTYEVLDEEVPADLTLPEAIKWTAADVDAAWAQVVAGNFDFAGKLVEMTIKVTVSGNYYNATVEGSTASLSISYPIDDVKQYLVHEAVITVIALPISFSNSSGTPKFFNFIITEVVVDDEAAANAVLNGLDIPKTATEDFDLEVVDGVTYAVKEANAALTISDNKVTVVRAENDVKVVIVATYTLNGKEYTKEFEVTVSGTSVAGPQHAGTAEDPYTVADANLVLATLAADVESEVIYVKGIISEIVDLSVSYGNATFTISLDGSNLTIFRAKDLNNEKFTSENAIHINDEVVICGNLVNYKGNTPQLTKGYIYSIVKTELTEAQKLAEDIKSFTLPSTLLDDTTFPITLANGTVVTYVVTGTGLVVDAEGNVTVTRPASGSEDAKVTVNVSFKNGEAVEDEGHVYEITVPAMPAAGEATTTLNFVDSFATYASDWKSTGYKVRTITSVDLNVSNINATIELSNASIQTGTITDRPVICAKNSLQYVTVMLKDAEIEAVDFNLQQWSATKLFVTLTIEYTTDGTTWQSTGIGIVDGTATTIAPNYETISANALPTGVVGVRFAYKGSSSSNTQIGLTSIVLKTK